MSDQLRDRLRARAPDILRAALAAANIAFTEEGNALKFKLRDEKTASCSFVLSGPNAGAIKDFGGDWKGDVFTMVARLRGLNCQTQFPEVLKACAELIGEPVPSEPPMPKRGQKMESRLPSAQATEPSDHDRDALAKHYGLSWEDFETHGCVLTEHFFGDAGKQPAVLYPATGLNGPVEKLKTLRRFLKDRPVGRDVAGSKRLARHKGGNQGVGFFPSPVFEALKPSQEVVLTGGEEKALGLLKAGLAAVSTTDGEKLSPPLAKLLAEKKPSGVVIVFDADDAGRKGNVSAAAALGALGIDVRVARWPECTPDKWDVNDTLKQEGIEGVRRLVAGALPWKPAGAPPPPHEQDWWRISMPSKRKVILETDDSGSLFSVAADGPRDLVAGGVFRVVEEQEMVVGGPKRILLEVRSRGRTSKVPINACAFQDDRDLKAALGGALPAFYIDNRSGVPALRRLAEEFRSKHPPQRVVLHPPGLTKPGEGGERRYLLPGLAIRGCSTEELRAFVSGTGPAPWGASGEEERVCRAFGHDGTLTLTPCREGPVLQEQTLRWCHAWPFLFESLEDAAIALGVTLFGPILPDLTGGPPRLLTAFVGTTGSGKTTAARLLGSFWGQFEILSQHGTWKADAVRATAGRHALTVVDDRRDGESLAEIVSLLFDGGSRQKLTRGGELNPSTPFEGALLLTAESLHGAGQSTMNRLIQIPFAPADPARAEAIRTALKVLTELRDASSGITVPAIAYALGQELSLPTRLQEFRDLARKCAKASDRGQDLAARAALCVELLREFTVAFIGSSAADWIPKGENIVRRVLAQHSKAEREASPAEVFLEALSSAAATDTVVYVVAHREGKSTIVLDEPEQPLRPGQVRAYRIREGKEAPDTLAIFPTETLRALRLDLSAKVLGASLRHSGYLRCTGTGQENTVVLRIASARGESHSHRLLALDIAKCNGIRNGSDDCLVLEPHRAEPHKLRKSPAVTPPVTE